MRDSGMLSLVRNGGVVAAAATALFLSACAGQDGPERAEPDIEELRGFLDGSRPIPGAADREEYRHTFAWASVRGAGARASGLDPESEDAWSPVVEQSGIRPVPADVGAWLRSGDIDVASAFVPLRAPCDRPPSAVAELPPELVGPELQARADRLACALDRLASREIALDWTPGLDRGVVLEPERGAALVNPRLIALIEPVAGPAPGGEAASWPGVSPSGPHHEQTVSSAEPAASPLDYDDNQNHPRPPTTSSHNDGSRTWCDRACDDVWNDLFSCDCNGSPGSGTGTGTGTTGQSSGCHCNDGAGSSSSGCGSNACKCGQHGRGAGDRTGALASLLVAGTLVLRRRKRHPPAPAPRRPRAVAGQARSRRARHLSGQARSSAAGRLSRRALARVRGLLSSLAGLLLLLVLAASAAAGPPAKLVDVRVVVTPAEAAVFVDGDAVTPAGGVVRVPAGSHTFSAQLEGYAQAVQNVDVPERGTGTLVTLRLVADKAYLVVTGSDPALVIAIDGSPVGKGAYSGLIAPGAHVVAAYVPGGAARAYSVTAVAGQSVTLSTDAPATYFPPAPPPPVEPPVPRKPPPPRVPPPSGPYAFASLGVVWQTSRPYGFEHNDTPSPGFAVGGRAGYRFNGTAGLEMLLEYGRVANAGVVLQTHSIDQNGDGAVSGGEAATDRSPADYLLESIRIGPVLRLATEGKVNRFAGGLGLGVLHEAIALNHANLEWDAARGAYLSTGTYHHHYEGWTPYLLFEGGYERSIGAFLTGILAQLTVESVSGIGGEPYNSSLQGRMSFCLRAGWAGF